MFGRGWFRGHHAHGCSGYAAAACGTMKHGYGHRHGQPHSHAGPASDEAKEYAELQALVVETVEAATQVARGNQPEHAARASEILKEARKKLYELLAQKA